ncbi:uncharacterized protein TNCV_4542981 [Trichonephila clavipes]|nr:uncharacterized protein TNCV_4542981 [Trichonephila clavipes]
MYRFPASPSRRLQWKIALQQKNWKANPKSVFCNKHFITERDENGDIIRIWLKFPKSCGRKQATKLRNLSARLNLDDDAVPITSQTSSVALNNNKTIIAKRKHFPLVSALAMTIHKSQGETRMKNEEPIHIPDFNFVASYKRPEVPAAGVAIYQHTQDTSHIVTSYMDIHTKFTRGIGVNVSDIGEICVARCNSENGQYILMVAVYISPEKSMQQIEQFLFENLMIYTKGSELLEKRFGEKFDDIPMILSGDFNINFADDKNLSLIEF